MIPRLILPSSVSKSLSTHSSSQLIRRSSTSRPIYSRISHFSSNTTTPTRTTKSVLIIGCNGALGQAVASLAPPNTTLIGADVTKPPPSSTLTSFVHLPHTSSVTDTVQSLRQGWQGMRVPVTSLDAVIVTAGGWSGDPPKGGDDDSPEGYARGMDDMLRKNLYPVFAGSLIAAELVKVNGLFLCVGANAALSPTPNMLAYGTSKSATHHLIETLGTKTKQPPSSQSQLTDTFEDICSIGLLPDTLNTVGNREAMPGADFGKWVDLEDVAEEVWRLVSVPHLRPQSGSLIRVFKEPGKEDAVFRLAR